MPYKNGPMPRLDVCQDCHSAVPFEEEILHTRWHENITDALLEHGQLREELASADLRAGALEARRDAAVRVAEATRTVEQGVTDFSLQHAAAEEFHAALELWERVR